MKKLVKAFIIKDAHKQHDNRNKELHYGWTRHASVSTLKWSWSELLYK